MRGVTQTAADDSTTLTRYEAGRLALITRRDAAGAQLGQTTYGYDAHGRQATVTDARNGATTYTYNAADQVDSVVSPGEDGLHNAQTNTYLYDNMGRLYATLLPDGAGVTNAFDLAGNLKRVSGARAYPAGYNYDAQGRKTAMTNWSNLAGTSGARVTYWAYDARRGWLASKRYPDGGSLRYTNTPAGRLLARAWARNLTNTYAYNAAGDLKAITYSDSTPALTLGYDRLGRVVGATNDLTTLLAYQETGLLASETGAGGVIAGLGLTNSYDAQWRRVGLSFNAQPSTLNYSYDRASRLAGVTNGRRFFASGLAVAGQQFEYSFDAIGNRTGTQAGGDSGGAGLRPATYSANTLNQYTSRTVPRTNDVVGSAEPGAGVTVNGQVAYRTNDYYQAAVALTTATTNFYAWVTNVSGATTVTGRVFVAATPEAFSYDADGNLTNDGRFAYAWDGENRLASLQSRATAPADSKLRLDFKCDYRGRRVQKVVSAWEGGAYVAQSTHRYLYDGWNLVAIFDAQGSPLYSFAWGLDLSGSMQGAGGVGGLLSLTVHSGTNAGTYFYCHDGNGNVAGLVSAADGTLAAQYEYVAVGKAPGAHDHTITDTRNAVSVWARGMALLLVGGAKGRHCWTCLA